MEKDILSLFKRGVNLAEYTTWKIGGEAQFFWEPDINTLGDVFKFCHMNGIQLHMLGRGSNTLISSEGVEGLVICTKKALLQIGLDHEGFIIAESGVPMPKLSKYAANMGWGGYEYLIGIPGTVGAGIAINAGLTANGRKEIGDVLHDVQVMKMDGETRWIKSEDLRLDYRDSTILNGGQFVVKARFKPTYKSSKSEIKHKTAEHLAERRRKQPLSKPTAGSTFKQPNDGKAAGWYIEQSGLKGYKVGDAMVSYKHANWIENLGNATSHDVLLLVEKIRSTVLKEFNIELENEFRYIE